jgi:hypothetical protein
VEYGPSGSATPLPKRVRRTPRSGAAPVSRFCYVCVHRRRGGEADPGQGPKDQLALLTRLGATWQKTEPAPTTHYVWADWYRIPIGKDDTLPDIQRVLHSRQLFDGPYYGCYRVGVFGWGQGAEKRVRGDKLAEQRFVALQRERKADRERFSLHRIMGEGFPYHLILTAPRAKFAGDSFGPVAGEWPLPMNAWFNLVKRFPEYERVFRLCSEEYAFWGECCCSEEATEGEIAAATQQFNLWGEWKQRLEDWTLARLVKPEETWVEIEEEETGPTDPAPWKLTASWWTADGWLESRSFFSFRTKEELQAKKKSLRKE